MASHQVPKPLEEIFTHVEGKQASYIEDLRDYVAVQTTSIDPTKWPLIIELTEKFNKRLVDLGAKTEFVALGASTQFLGQGDQVGPPPLLLGSFGSDPKKKTILYYFHLDIHMTKADRWDTDPYNLTEKNGKLIGRGVTNAKAPPLCWLHVLEAYKELKQTPPVNIKFVLEGLFEMASPGFEAACLSRKAFFSQVDCVCITNSTWIGTRRPCVVYGHRGLCYFEVTVQGMNRDLHSGDYGGVICEPMSDLIMLMNSLQDHNYKITIPGVMDNVLEPTEQEYEAFKKIDVSVDEMRELVGTTEMAHKEKKERILMHRWRLPSLSLHGVEGAETEELEKTIIPSKVTGKFSIRLVENQKPEHVAKCVANYLENMWKEMNSSNTLQVKLSAATRPWSADPNGPIFKVAQKAVKHAYNMDADMTRAGTTNGASVPLKLLTGKPVVLMCVGAGDSKVQCPNEQLGVQRFMDGHKLMAAFMHEVAESL